MDQLNDLIDALRDFGLSIPDEVSTIPHLIIAVRAQPKRNGAPAGGGGADGGSFDLSATRTPDRPPRLDTAADVIREQERLAKRLSAGAQ